MHWTKTAIKTIRSMSISHRNWNRAFSDSFAFLTASAMGEVVCITGPSRAGKSRLIRKLISMLDCGQISNEINIMPVVSVLATNCSVRGGFSTKEFTIRALEAVKHPIFGVVHNDYELEVKRLKLLARTSEGVLRLALEHALIQRQTRYFFIDEAQHIQYVLNNERHAAAILESWKCLAQSTGTTLVLVGAYPLLNILKLCPHMLGRKHQVHLPRYQYVENDLLAFSEIIEVYSELIVLPEGVESLNDWIDLLYEGSMGCIGLLEGWLRGALAYVDANDERVLTLAHLKAARRSKIEEAEISQEITEGEKVLGKAGGISYVSAVESSDLVVSNKKKINKKRGKPFRRSPKRYDIGDLNGGIEI